MTINGPTATPPASGTTAEISGGAIPQPNQGSPVVPDTIIVEPGVTANINNVAVRLAEPSGSGIDVFGAANVSDSEFTQNAGNAITVGATATLSLTNSTVQGNLLAGIDVQGSATFLNDTIANNHGDGISNEGGSTTSATNTIISGNTINHGSTNCAAPLTTTATSLDNDGSCGVAHSSVNPQLAGIGIYGGTTQTMPRSRGARRSVLARVVRRPTSVA